HALLRLPLREVIPRAALAGMRIERRTLLVDNVRQLNMVFSSNKTDAAYQAVAARRAGLDTHRDHQRPCLFDLDRSRTALLHLRHIAAFEEEILIHRL